MRTIFIGVVVVALIAIVFWFVQKSPGPLQSIVQTSSVAPHSGIPAYSHIVVVVLENHSYEQVIGNAAMPYLNSLATAYGSSQNYYANTHPSIGNYFMLATGQILTNNDNFSGVVNAPNIVTSLNDAGKSWKVYAEDIPASGYTGGNLGNYLKRHNPFSYLSTVTQDSSAGSHIVPFSQLAADLASGSLPNLAWIVPNACNDAHDCALSQADIWLKQNISPIIDSQDMKVNGLVVITFDEGKKGDNRHGGGKIPLIFAGAHVKEGYVSQEVYQHQNLLRTILEGLSAKQFPGAAASASVMGDFFQ